MATAMVPREIRAKLRPIIVPNVMGWEAWLGSEPSADRPLIVGSAERKPSKTRPSVLRVGGVHNLYGWGHHPFRVCLPSGPATLRVADQALGIVQ